MKYFVYILQGLKNGNLYIGQTNNVENRLKRHNEGQVLATKSRRPFIVIHTESFDLRADAMKREKYLKSLKNPSYILNKIVKQ